MSKVGKTIAKVKGRVGNAMKIAHSSIALIATIGHWSSSKFFANNAIVIPHGNR